MFQYPHEVYYSVVIPFVKGCPTAWHPTDRDFAPLTRGAFKSVSEAHTWAHEHIGSHSYTVRRYTACGDDWFNFVGGNVWLGVSLEGCV